MPDGVASHYSIPVRATFQRYLGYLIRNHASRFDYFFGDFLDWIPKELFASSDLLVINEIEYLAWAGFRDEPLSTIPLYLDLHEDHVNDAHRGPLEAIAFKKYWQWQLLQLREFVASRRPPLRITSVEEVIASDYEKLLNRPVEIIRNAPDTNSLIPIQTQQNKIQLVHHGMGTKGRGIELAIRALSKLDSRFSLTLVLFSTPQFRVKIELLARILRVRNRLEILPGVPLRDLPNLLNRYDVSVVVLPSKTPGHANALPNKFFESIHAKLAIVTGPNPTMSRLVKEFDLGVAMSSWTLTELVETLGRLNSSSIERYKENSLKASESLSSRQSSMTFKRLVAELTNEAS